MDFEVLILGSDINAYYLARCTHEAYNKKAYVLAKNKLAFTHYSNILNITYCDIWDEKKFVEKLNEFAKQFNNKKILLISSNETYGQFITKNKDKIADNYVYNYPSLNIYKSLIDKEIFYKKYNKDLDMPKTYFYNCSIDDDMSFDLKYPIIVKPADVVSYNHLNFPNKCKIYKIKCKEDLLITISSIKRGGYKNDLIIQEYIPGDDSHLFDSVIYVDKNHKVKAITFAQIGLQEHNRNLVGNAAVLINGYNSFNSDNKEAIKKINTFMEKIKYQGFAEVDWKYDERDKTFKVLEINARQGRSSYYITKLGYNIIEVLVDDLIFNKEIPYKELNDEVILSFVPKKIIKNYVVNEKFRKKALDLWKTSKVINPVKYNRDRHPWRLYLYFRKYLYYINDYKCSYWDNK